MGEVHWRLRRELPTIQNGYNESFTAIADADNMFVWNPTIICPDDRNWMGGVFKLNSYFSQLMHLSHRLRTIRCDWST
jgi:ubiquitin-protein ligase